MVNFENLLVNSLNQFFDSINVRALVYRRKQAKFQGQDIDVLVDSNTSLFYCGIECKSIKQKKIYFKQHFHGGDQITAINNFLYQTGRTGFLAVERRYGKGKTNQYYFIPWDYISERFENNKSGLLFDDFSEFLFEKSGGNLKFDTNLFKAKTE